LQRAQADTTLLEQKKERPLLSARGS
jgi:hypothetical protein